MRISAKIYFLLGLLVLLSVTIAGFAARNILELARGEQVMVDGDAASLRWAASAKEHMTRSHQLVFQINDTDFGASGVLRDRLRHEQDGLKSDLERFHAVMTPDEVALFSAIRNRSEQYAEFAAQDLRLLRLDERADAKALLLSQGVQAFERADAAFSQMVGKQTLDMGAAAAAANRQSQGALWFMVLASTIGAAGVGALAIFIARREISAPLILITKSMAQLAAGDMADAPPPNHRRDEIGDLSRVFTVFRDNAIALLVARNEAEEQRKLLEIERLSGGFFRSAIESSLDSVRVLDLDGRLLFMNRGGLTAFEIDDISAYSGRFCQSLWPEPAATQIGVGVEAALHGRTHRFEGMCPTAKGAEKWWDVFIAPVHDAAGAISAIIATSRDVTDAHQVRVESEVREMELARSATALRLAFKVARVGGWEVDFLKQETTFSDELCELIGMAPMAHAPNLDLLGVWFEEDREPFQAALDQVANTGRRLDFEGRTLAPDGSFKWWRLFGEPVIEGGRCVALRGATQEMTDWRGMQERERAAVAAADAMSGFLATMSHELRTPLNGVLGMAQAMARGELSSPQRERLAVIRESGDALLSLLNDLLDLSKIEAGKTVLEDGVVDIGELAQGARAIFNALAGDKDVTLDLTVDPSADGCWRGDPTRVRQVLHNLISNAVKFTDRGSVTVDLSRCETGLTFKIADTGVGIAPDRLDHVFERFVQADASTTRRHGGSGLGLTICRELVDLMGGEIEVRSAEGAGTVFTVRLPLARAEGPPPQLAIERDVDLGMSGAGLRVLAAEDNPTNQIVLKALLGQVGIKPHMVSNGQEALEAFVASDWDLVLMDIQMPVMDGLTALGEIRQAEDRRGRAHTPVIALTANAMAHHQAEYLSAGMNGVVAKPIDFAALLETIDAVLTSPEADQSSARAA